jgi:hypothetical protein
VHSFDETIYKEVGHSLCANIAFQTDDWMLAIGNIEIQIDTGELRI